VRKELIVAGVIYFVTMFALILALYTFFEMFSLSVLDLFGLSILMVAVAMGWGYILTSMLLSPQTKMENRLTSLTNDIVHELNIPLSTIQANVSMLKKSTEDDKTLKRLVRIEDASVRLKKLYDELVYSLHKEMQTIDKEKVDIASLVRERVAIFEEQQRNPFVLHLVSYEVEIDKIGFEQMIDNLISNAMKYSSKTSTIEIELREDILRIEDNGIGMSTAELLRVHERYYQADTSQVGMGLGLSLVREYCESEGIDIQIHSEKNVGTRIDLNLLKVKI